jgi:hypothetical protein
VVASLQLTSGWGAVLAMAVMGTLFLLWIGCLFLLAADTISGVAKVAWFLLLTFAAPFTIPLYLILRHHRHGVAAAAA